jgi:predicted DNA-binding transcriptional regulator AlpA
MERFLSLADVGRLIGVSRQRAAQLRDDYADFPKPTAEIPTGPAWQRADVEAWLARHPSRPVGRHRKDQPR